MWIIITRQANDKKQFFRVPVKVSMAGGKLGVKVFDKDAAYFLYISNISSCPPKVLNKKT